MREARAVMADLAGTGLTPDQLALLMELSASLAAEARPVRDESADRRRAKDREYQASKRQRRHNRQKSADSADRPPYDTSTPPVSSDEETSIAAKSKREQVAKPDEVSEQVWADFRAHRQAKKAPVNATAIDGIRKEATKAGWTLEAALAETVSRGWQGFKAEWVAAATGPPSGSQPTSFFEHVRRRQATPQIRQATA